MEISGYLFNYLLMLEYFDKGAVSETDILRILKHKQEKYDLDKVERVSAKFSNVFSGAITKILEKQVNIQSIPDIEPDKTYETGNICELLNVSKQIVQKWITNKHLIAEQKTYGGKYHITETELLKFLNGYGRKYLKIWNIKRLSK